MKKLLIITLLFPLFLFANEEAQRYFEEYNRLARSQGSGQEGERLKYLEAAPKLFAALALDPMNENIRAAELDYYSVLLHDTDIRKRLVPAREQLERAKKFRHDFPNSNVSLFEISHIYGECPTNRTGNCPAELFPEYAALSREVRTLEIDEMKRIWYPFDLSDGINSQKELANLHDVTIRSNRADFYFCDPAEWLRQRLADYELLYRHAEEYIRTHPGEKAAVNQIVRENSFCDMMYPNLPFDRKTLEKHLRETRAFCQFIQSSQLDSVNVESMVLDAMRESFPELTEQSVERACKRLIERIAVFNPELVKPLNSPNEDRFINRNVIWNLREFCRKAGVSDEIPMRMLQEYQRAHGLFSEFGELENLTMGMMRGLRGEVYPKLGKLAESLRKFNMERLKNNNFGNACGSLAEYIFRSDREKGRVEPDDMKFFTELNRDFEIETVYYGDLTGFPGSMLAGAAESDGEILIFFTDGSFVIRQKDGAFSPMVKAPAQLGRGNMQTEYRTWHRPLAFSRELVVFGDGNQNLHLYDRRGKSWREYPEFSPVPLRSLLIHDGILYALAGDMEWGVFNQPLWFGTIRTDGTGKKILFSSERSEKLTPLDSMRGGLSGLYAYSENELVFLLTYTNNYSMVWRYKIRENTFDKLFQLPVSGTDEDFLNRQKDGGIYVVSYGWSERFYQILPKEKKGVPIFFQSGGKNKNDPPDSSPVLFHGRSQLRAPWILDGEELWCGGGTTAFLNLRNINGNPPMLLLPHSPYLFELTDGKKLFLSQYRLFIVKKKGSVK